MPLILLQSEFGALAHVHPSGNLNLRSYWMTRVLSRRCFQQADKRRNFLDFLRLYIGPDSCVALPPLPTANPDVLVFIRLATIDPRWCVAPRPFVRFRVGSLWWPWRSRWGGWWAIRSERWSHREWWWVGGGRSPILNLARWSFPWIVQDGYW